MPIRRRTRPPSRMAFSMATPTPATSPPALETDIVYQENHVVPVQVLFRDPQGIGLLQREGVGFGRVDLRIDVPGLELLRIDRRDIQSSCYKTGQGDTGAFRSQYLGDPHTPETLCQRVSHVLHQIYIHTVIEEHVHVDDVPLADHRVA